MLDLIRIELKRELKENVYLDQVTNNISVKYNNTITISHPLFIFVVVVVECTQQERFVLLLLLLLLRLCGTNKRQQQIRNRTHE